MFFKRCFVVEDGVWVVPVISCRRHLRQLSIAVHFGERRCVVRLVHLEHDFEEMVMRLGCVRDVKRALCESLGAWRPYSEIVIVFSVLQKDDGHGGSERGCCGS